MATALHQGIQQRLRICRERQVGTQIREIRPCERCGVSGVGGRVPDGFTLVIKTTDQAGEGLCAVVEFVVANRIGLNTKQIVDLNISNTGVTVKITRCGKEQSGEVCVAGTQGEGDIASIGILKRLQDGFSTRDIVKNGQARGLLIVDVQQLQRKCHGDALIWGPPKVITNGGIPR